MQNTVIIKTLKIKVAVQVQEQTFYVSEGNSISQSCKGECILALTYIILLVKPLSCFIAQLIKFMAFLLLLYRFHFIFKFSFVESFHLVCNNVYIYN